MGWFSWGDAAKQFEQAQKNPALLQVFVNAVLGETWTLLGEAPDWQKLYDRREAYKLGTVPRGGLFLAAGVDVQKDRIEVEIVGWGRGKESWSVDYRVFEGDISRPQVWEQLTALLDGEHAPDNAYDVREGFAAFVVRPGRDRFEGLVCLCPALPSNAAVICSARSLHQRSQTLGFGGRFQVILVHLANKKDRIAQW